ncbi:hypothetical protein Tco_0348530 [Tanacetum coccineum]
MALIAFLSEGCSGDLKRCRECLTRIYEGKPLSFKGTREWLSYPMVWKNGGSVFRISNCSVENQVSSLLYVGGLPDMIHGNIVASKPKTMQEAIEMATELMDKRVSTMAERQAENKRKLENISRNNQNQQQQQNKKQHTGRDTLLDG